MAAGVDTLAGKLATVRCDRGIGSASSVIPNVSGETNFVVCLPSGEAALRCAFKYPRTAAALSLECRFGIGRRGKRQSTENHSGPRSPACDPRPSGVPSLAGAGDPHNSFFHVVLNVHGRLHELCTSYDHFRFCDCNSWWSNPGHRGDEPHPDHHKLLGEVFLGDSSFLLLLELRGWHYFDVRVGSSHFSRELRLRRPSAGHRCEGERHQQGRPPRAILF